MSADDTFVAPLGKYFMM